MAPLHPPLLASCAALERRLRAVVRRTLTSAGAAATEPLIVACSGGPDSVALLQATAGVRRAGQPLVAVYVDHRLRPGTEAEAALVQDHANRLGLGFVGLTVEPISRAPARRTAGRSPEEAARTVRYQALARLARRQGSRLVLVGHTRRDLAETVLLRLLQGTGPGGLAAMTPVSAWPLPGRTAGLWLLRPLLDVGRDEVEALVAARALGVVTDPSNVDPRFLRNRIRSELVPALTRLQPAIEERLAHLAQLSAADRAVHELLLDAELERRTGAPGSRSPGVLLTLDLRGADLPLRLALLHRTLALRRNLLTLGGLAPRPGLPKLRQAVSGAETDLGGGLRASFRSGYLRIHGPHPGPRRSAP